MPGKRWSGLALVAIAAPAQAECLGSCADDLAAAFLSMLVYGVIGIVLLVMLIRAKWRRAGLWGLGLVLVLSLAVPLISQVWMSWKLRSVEGREIVAQPPKLAERTPLLMIRDQYCEADTCEAVVRGRGAAGVYVVRASALASVDLSQPVAIADMPIEFWVQPSVGGVIQRRELSALERQAAAARIDYLVVTNLPYFPADPGPIEAALRENPALAGMGAGEAVRLMLAPLEPGKEMLTLASLQPDVLDLSLLDRALAIPLAPRNTQGAGNTAVGLDAAARSICPPEAGDPASGCRSLLDR